MDLLNLDGKTAVVTGGAKGIGAATSRVLERAGARVAVFDIEPRSTIWRSEVSPVDVTSESAVKEAFSRVAERFGGIDILVNNAGRVARKPAVELGLRRLAGRHRREPDGHVPLFENRASLYETRGGGAIVNVASIMGLSGGLFPNASYQAAKGGVVNLTRALALEWAADGIRVNAVAPTYRGHRHDEGDFLESGPVEYGDAAHAARPPS